MNTFDIIFNIKDYCIEICDYVNIEDNIKKLIKSIDKLGDIIYPCSYIDAIKNNINLINKNNGSKNLSDIRELCKNIVFEIACVERDLYHIEKDVD